MKMQTAVVILILIALAGPVAADPLPLAKPEDVGVSSQRLERIGQTLRADIEKGRMPGAVVAIARKGKLIYYEAHGYLDKAAGIPMPKDAIFSIASMTKPMTGVAAMMLVEEGRLFLSDPVGQYLPPLGKMPVAVIKTDAGGQVTVRTVAAKRPMTIQDLMRHTSGLTYGGRGDTAVHKMYPESSNVASRTYTGSEFIEKLGTLPLLYHPGTVWDYSLSIDVLGLVVEAISKQSLGQVLRCTRLQTPRDERYFFLCPPGEGAALRESSAPGSGHGETAVGGRFHQAHQIRVRRRLCRLHRRGLPALRPDALEPRPAGRGADPRPQVR